MTEQIYKEEVLLCIQHERKHFLIIKKGKLHTFGKIKKNSDILNLRLRKMCNRKVAIVLTFTKFEIIT